LNQYYVVKRYTFIQYANIFLSYISDNVTVIKHGLIIDLHRVQIVEAMNNRYVNANISLTDFNRKAKKLTQKLLQKNKKSARFRKQSRLLKRYNRSFKSMIDDVLCSVQS
jgi:hypothetical protein